MKTKKCSKCAEEIKKAAKVCKHCNAKQGIGCVGGCLVVFMAFILISVVVGLSSPSPIDSSTRTTQEKTVAVKVPTSEEAIVESNISDVQFEEDKQNVRTYYERVLQIASKGDSSYDTMQAFLDSGNMLSAYVEMTTTMNILNTVESELIAYKDKVILHNKMNEAAFKEGIDLLQSAYQWRRWGVRDMKKYIDEQKLKHAESAQNSMNMFNNKLIFGSAKLVEVQMYYGLLEE
jgi:hypothetical protein